MKQNKTKSNVESVSDTTNGIKNPTSLFLEIKTG